MVELVVLLEPEPVELLVNDKEGRYVNVADDLLEICPEATEICHSITSELFVTGGDKILDLSFVSQNVRMHISEIEVCSSLE